MGHEGFLFFGLKIEELEPIWSIRIFIFCVYGLML